ncbi:hypothetical protein KDK95_20480 [Actinospica sp. MGRD01-02]|uniref:Intein C-terminal splicing domain-containing protein n=1 Tax=Actinospica acidithermotolerans TaxID=2828514 RepID=A0A941EDX1_9ACTN|nr:RHS repeat-associated core domain-containing protein [Actinospica acidithermotolerans]MBR7828697.1 hypothetical protein [Actinospica acidithermotolerans]
MVGQVAWAETAAAVQGRSAPRPPATASVPVSPVVSHYAKKTPIPSWRAPKPVWPSGSATVDVSAKGSAAGALPVTVSVPAAGAHAQATSAATAPTSVSVTVEPKAAATAAGVNGVLLRLDRADGRTGNGTLLVSLSYAEFQDAYGADWGQRLTLVALPACSLTTPNLPTCRVETPVKFTHDLAARTLEASVTLPGAAQGSKTAATSAAHTAAGFLVLAADSSSSSGGGGGDFTATTLKPSGSWSAGGATDAFTWSYPISVPGVPGGMKPNLALSYNSQSVDGLTSRTNNQAGIVGDGWGVTESYVERSYQTCHQNPTGSTKTYDNCWTSDNELTLDLNGSTSTLVKDDTTGDYHPLNDSNERVQHETGATNGAQSGEYWIITTADGTEYYFGLNQLPGFASGDPTTNSVDTEPVYSTADLTGSCYNSTFSKSYCEQAYRWNLDYVVDPHGNASSYWYTTDTNYYAQDLGTTAASTSVYTRDSVLSKIEYGQRSGSMYSATPAAEVQLSYNGRCQTSSTGCATSGLSTSTASNWPDVPYDLNCESGAACSSQSPSFWTEDELTGIQTQGLVGSTLDNVDSWALAYSFPPIPGASKGDTSTPALWLASITHTGQDTTAEPSGGIAIPLDSVTFTPTAMENRANLSEGYPWITRDRLTQITTETGEQITVDYSAPACGSSTPSDDSQNTMLCYPEYWYPAGDPSPIKDYFNVFIVNSVTEHDPTGGNDNDDIVTSYTPVGNPAWHYDDNPMTPTNQATWNEFRGYQGMTVSTGTAPDPATKTQYTYFQGMNGDYLTSSSTRSVSVSDTRGGSVPDDNQYAGTAYETQVFNGSSLVTDTINTPWSSAATATHALPNNLPSQQSFMTGQSSTRVYTPLADGSTRETETDYTHDSDGRVTQTNDLGDVTQASQNQCTTTTYADNTSAWIMDLTAEVKTVSVKCSTPPTLPADAMSDKLTFYDGSTTLGAAPSAGNPTMTQAATSYTGSTPTYTTMSRTAYDEYGRVTSSTDADGNVTTTAYTPATGAEQTSTKVTDPMGLVTTTNFDPLRDLTTQTTNPAGYVTTEQYDALGRQTAVYEPGQLASTGTPNLKFSYNVSDSAASVVDSYTLNDDGTYRETEVLYDSMLRSRESQAQTVDGGRDITDVYYNTDGLESETTGQYYNSSAISTTYVQAQPGVVPSATGYTYDGDGRKTAMIAYALGTQTWQTTYSYGGDFATTVPPAGGTAQTVVTNARNEQTDLIQYLAGDPTNYLTDPVADYTDTKYTYFPNGKPATETDAAGNQWSWQYDLLGRQISATDPDTGTTESTYDNNGNVLTVTDERGKQTTNNYDKDSRKVSSYDTTSTQTQSSGNEIASWTFDTIKKGMATSSTSYSNGDTYTSSVLGYNSLAKPQATKITLTGTDAGLVPTAGLTTTYGYTLTGSLSTQTDPAEGSLPTETLNYGYDEFGQPTSLKSTGGTTWTYVSAIGYDEFGDPLEYTMPTVGGNVWAQMTYDPQTQALDSVQTTDSTDAYVVDNLTYSYGNSSGSVSKGSGLVTQIQDAQQSASTVDTQCFTYDYAQRLQQAWTATDACASIPSSGNSSTVGGTDSPYWQSWTYNAAGNRLTEVDHDTSGNTANDTTTTYNYPTAGTSQSDTLSSTTSTGPQASQNTATYKYDTAGETILISGGALGSQSLAWNDQDKLQSVTTSAGATNYAYDASGTQIVVRDPGSTTFTDGDTQIVSTAGVLSGTRYYNVGGTTIAERTSTGLVYDLIPDRQGTDLLEVATTSAQTVIRRQYLPFGATRGTSSWVGGTKGYVGGSEDPTTGMETLGARVYDDVSGRFLSPDPIFEKNDPTQMAGYDYAANDPVTGSDKNGQMFYIDGYGGCGSIAACTQAMHNMSCAQNPVQSGCPGYQFVDPNTNTALFGPIVFSSAMPDYNKRLKQNQPAYDSQQQTEAEQGVLNKLEAAAALAALDGYKESVALLGYWMSKQGGLLIMGQSAIGSYYNVPSVKTMIDSQVRKLMANKAPGPSSFVSMTGWMNPPPKTPTYNGPFSLAFPPSSGGDSRDWYLTMDEMDVRVAAYKSSADQITFSFQVAKYYSFDHSFGPMGLSPSQLEGLNTQGYAQNFYVVGQSAPMTISTN